MRGIRNTYGAILVEVLLAVTLVALIIVPVVSTLSSAHKSATWSENNTEALNLAQSCLEELLANGPEAWISQPFCPVPDNPDFELAVGINLLPARLYEIHVYIRWGEVPDAQTLELATLATPAGRSRL